MLKNNKKYVKIIVLNCILIFFFLFFLFYYGEQTENYEISQKTRTLEKDGFCVFQNDAYNETINLPCSVLRRDVLNHLPEHYEFIDYIYEIRNGALSTFHRDVTSSKNIYNTVHPVYTLILYKYDGELLSICPESNKSYPFVWSTIVNIKGKKGTAFLFDCDILHAGCVNQCRERNVIQYKLCHKDDLPKLTHLHGIRKYKEDTCNISFYQLSMRKMSYYFEMPINTFFYPLMIKRNHPNTIVGMIQSFIPVEYYNNY
jgi:hypothetical protein